MKTSAVRKRTRTTTTTTNLLYYVSPKTYVSGTSYSKVCSSTDCQVVPKKKWKIFPCKVFTHQNGLSVMVKMLLKLPFYMVLLIYYKLHIDFERWALCIFPSILVMSITQSNLCTSNTKKQLLPQLLALPTTGSKTMFYVHNKVVNSIVHQIV